MLPTLLSGGSAREGARRREAHALAMALVVAQAGLISLATAGAALAQSRPESPSTAPAPSPGPTTAPKVLAEDDASRVAALEKTIRELREKGRLVEAIGPAREVLAIRLKATGEDNPDVEDSYLNLATILEALGRSAEAGPLHREALKIRGKRVRDDDIAMISFCLDAVKLQQERGNFAAAESLTHIALERCRTIERPDGLEAAQVLTRLASRLEDEGHESDAELPFRQALAIHRRVLGADDTRTAVASYHLARCLHLQKKEDEAERLCQTAIEIGGRHPGEANSQMGNFRELLAACLKARGKEVEAEAESRRAVAARSAEASLPIKEGGVQILLINGPLGAATRPGQGVVEGPILVDGQVRRWAAVTEFEPPSTKEPGSAAGHVLDLEAIQARLPADAALVAWVDRSGMGGVPDDPAREHWACVVRPRGAPVWVRILGGETRDEWTADDDDRLDQFRAGVCRRPENHSGHWRVDADALARRWLAPLEPHLVKTGELPAATRLIVLPSQALSGVPIETLVGPRADGRPRYIVSYAQSVQVFTTLSDRHREGTGPSRPPRLLALGDPIFTGPETHAPPQGETPRPLPGTRAEVLAIASLFERPETLVGSEASEQRVDDLARSGRLREFDFIHLATHGKLDRRDAHYSALLLARDRLSDPLQQILAGTDVYDGELSAEQVFYTWALNAELVTLSACWSGLGRPSGRSGPLGFSDALIRAGAKSVVLGLWNVDDAATQLLMTRFYHNLLGHRAGMDRPLPKAEALAEAKQWLRSLSADEVDRHCAGRPAVDRLDKVSGPPRAIAKAAHPYEHPYYWAAFILNGDPN